MTPMVWLSTIAYCSTIYHAKSNLTHISLDKLMSKSAVLTAVQPWDHLDRFKSSPDCVTFVLDSIGDYQLAFPTVSKSRVRVEFALILALEEYRTFDAEKCSHFDCHVALLDPDLGVISGTIFILQYNEIILYHSN